MGRTGCVLGVPTCSPWHTLRANSLLLSPQTRVLVTHGISFLPQTDFIIVMADGQVSEMGPYSELMQRDGSFANFLRNYTFDEGPVEEQQVLHRMGTRHPGPSKSHT